MKQIKNIFLIAVGILFFVSCEKHEIEYNSSVVGDDVAEFQLHYFVPVNAAVANNITKVEINDILYSNNTALLLTYNGIPAGVTGKFYTTKVGSNNIKLYQGSDEKQKLVYDQNCDLTKGKQNIFVYDFAKPPIVFDNGYPYVGNTTVDTDPTAWVKFYNFLYEKEGVTTDLKLQYQYQYTTDYSVTPNPKSDWINVGSPVGFGETTGWQPITIIKSVTISSGYARIDYRIKVISANGEDLGLLQVMNSNGVFINYSDWWTGYIGRRYHHTLSGMRAAKPNCAVRQFTAL